MYPGGEFIVTVPPYVQKSTIETYVHTKSAWVLKHLARLKQLPKPLLRKNSRAEYITHKQAALERVTRRLAYFNQFYNLNIGTVRIKNQKTRWGSCSKKGNLNFNYKIALLPDHLADYIIVHELCHVGQFNHSRNFWNLVGQTIPDYKILRATLKKYQ